MTTFSSSSSSGHEILPLWHAYVTDIAQDKSGKIVTTVKQTLRVLIQQIQFLLTCLPDMLLLIHGSLLLPQTHVHFTSPLPLSPDL